MKLFLIFISVFLPLIFHSSAYAQTTSQQGYDHTENLGDDLTFTIVKQPGRQGESEQRSIQIISKKVPGIDRATIEFSDKNLDGKPAEIHIHNKRFADDKRDEPPFDHGFEEITFFRDADNNISTDGHNLKVINDSRI